MNKSLLTAKNIIIQGITGTHGAFHATAMRANGASVVAGTSPNKAGQEVDGVRVYRTIVDIKKDFTVDTSIVFVPASFAKDAMLEAIDEHIPLIICITEGVPVHDMLEVKQRAKENDVTLIGPNCPGVLIPGGNKLGIIPYMLGLPGNVGIVSRSGTLTYEVTASLSARGIGQSAIIGIGGDRIHGIGFIECLEMFENDPETHAIVLIGEIGGTEEIEAAKYIESSVIKPVYAYIAGYTAPAGVQLGHAGAILESDKESAEAKMNYLANNGIGVFKTIHHLVATLAK
jgi:succinyl-CoA synthetase alpha subunit